MDGANVRASATAEQILDVAERLVQARGFNGFSYADVAAELGITKAALHYHFPAKSDLGQALIDRYAQRFLAALAEVEALLAEAPARLRAYADLYGQALQGDRMCLCGMLAAEYRTLPESMRQAVARFFDANEAWLEKVLAEGRRQGSLAFAGSAREAARLIVSGLEGAMLVARPYGEIERFTATVEHLIASLTAARPR